MKVPKYIQEMMSRSEFIFWEGDPGYTIKIRKSTPYTRIQSFRDEIDRLVNWVNRQMPQDEFSILTIVINDVPSKTHYVNQIAIVTIYDPIMKELEKYIGKEVAR